MGGGLSKDTSNDYSGVLLGENPSGGDNCDPE